MWLGLLRFRWNTRIWDGVATPWCLVRGLWCFWAKRIWRLTDPRRSSNWVISSHTQNQKNPIIIVLKQVEHILDLSKIFKDIPISYPRVWVMFLFFGISILHTSGCRYSANMTNISPSLPRHLLSSTLTSLDNWLAPAAVLFIPPSNLCRDFWILGARCGEFLKTANSWWM